MKKLFALSILSLSILASVSFAEAQTMTTTTTRVTTRQRPGFQNRRVRIVTRTRTVRVGGRTYRETIQTRHLPNGRTVTRVISRVRVR